MKMMMKHAIFKMGYRIIHNDKKFQTTNTVTITGALTGIDLSNNQRKIEVYEMLRGKLGLARGTVSSTSLAMMVLMFL